MAACMTKTGGAHARHLPRSRRGVSTTLISNVEDDVVAPGRAMGHAARHMIELKDMTRPVRDVVTRSRVVERGNSHSTALQGMPLPIQIAKPEALTPGICPGPGEASPPP